MAHKRINLIVKGKVQRAGYRSFIEETADKLDLTGYTENLSDGSVSIVAEGKEENLNKLVEEINIDEFPIKVTSIEKKYENYKGEFEYFELRRKKGEELHEILERADVAAKYMRKMINSMDKMSENLSEKMDNTTKQLSEKMEKTTNKLSQKMDSTTKQLSENLNSKTDQFRQDTNQNFQTLNSKTDQFRQDTNQNFQTLNNKYGEISEKLGEAVKYLKKNSLNI